MCWAFELQAQLIIFGSHQCQGLIIVYIIQICRYVPLCFCLDVYFLKKMEEHQIDWCPTVFSGTTLLLLLFLLLKIILHHFLLLFVLFLSVPLQPTRNDYLLLLRYINCKEQYLPQCLKTVPVDRTKIKAELHNTVFIRMPL